MKALIASIVLLIFCTTAIAQDSEVEKLRHELEQLREKVEHLEEENHDEEEEEEEHEHGHAGEAHEQEGAHPHRDGEGEHHNLLDELGIDPHLSVVVNLFGRIDNDEVLDEAGDPIDDRFWAREIELGFRAALTPYASGTVTPVIESERPGEAEIGIEEGFLEFRDADQDLGVPDALSLKMGRYRLPVGTMNQLHTHELPWAFRPLPVEYLLGHEGAIGDGVMLLLNGHDDDEHAQPFRASIGIFNGGLLEVTEDNEGQSQTYVGRAEYRFEEQSDWDGWIGASMLQAHTDVDGEESAQIFVIDGVLRLNEGSDKGWVVLGAEYHSADLDFDVLNDASVNGGTFFANWRFVEDWYVSGHYDTMEDPTDDELRDERYGIYLIPHLSDRLDVRVGWQRFDPDDARNEDPVDSILIHISFVLGHHPPHSVPDLLGRTAHDHR